MPSISDVYNQLTTANANLQQIHNDLAGQLHSDLANVIAATNAVRNSTDNVAGDVQTLIGLQTYANQALFHLSQQNDTIICALEQISKNTCNLLSEAHLQSGLQQVIENNTAALRELAESAHPDAALALERMKALRDEVYKCCPKEVPPPACQYEPCPTAPSLPAPPKPPDKQPLQ